MQENSLHNHNRITIRGIAAALIFASCPFMYGVILGQGIFIYLAAFFIVALCMYAIFNTSNCLSFKVQTSEKMFFGSMLWEGLSYIWSPATSFNSMYVFGKIVLLFLLISTCSYSRRESLLMMRATAMVSIFAIYSVLTSDVVFSTEGVDSMRVSFSFFGVMQDPNYLCFFFLMPVAFLLSNALDRKSVLPKKLFCWAALAYLLYGILRTGSRGGLIGALTVIAIYLCTFQKQKGKTVFLIIFLAIIAILLYDQLMNMLPQAIASRFTIENILANGGSNRTVIWKQYSSAIFSDPFILILGNGNGSGAHNFGFAAHNHILEIWYEYGLIGVSLLGVFYLSILKSARRNNNWIAYSVVWGILLMSQTLSVGKNYYFWLAVLLANVVSKDRQERIDYGYI